MSERAAYLRDGTAIYQRSFAIIRAEADLSQFSAAEAEVAVRMIHACGQVEAAAHIVFGGDVVTAARQALTAGAPIFCDAEMVAHGITRARLPARNDVICTLNDPRTPGIAAKRDTTRSAAALDLWLDRLAGAVVAIGNAPTALFRLLDLLDAGAPKPAAILGIPVGFVGAAEFEGSARRRAARHTVHRRTRPHGRQRHVRRRRQRAGEDRTMSAGKLIGVGVGPGDPELMTLKAMRALGEADVIAHFAKAGNESHSRAIAAQHLRAEVIELPLLYPVTTELPKDSDGYREAIGDFYDVAATAIAAHLDAGRIVAVICEGDPMFYGSYMHLHTRLASRFSAEIVAGVTGMSGCWSAAGMPIAQGDDVFTVLPATLPEGELTRRLADADAAVVMKVGRHLPKLRRALDRSGRLPRAIYVERGTMADAKMIPLTAKPDDDAPYFAVVLVPGWAGRPGGKP